MNNAVKTVVGVALGIVGVIALAITLELGSLSWARFFNPKWENVKRETFEQSKSYVHGKIQDLSKHYEEYQKGDETERAAIKNVIQFNFADLDAENIKSLPLRNFLVEQRGY